MRKRAMFDDIKDFLAHAGFGALFALLCGLVGYLHRQVTSKRRISLLEAFVRGLGSAITGSLVMMACLALKIEMAWAGVIVGTFGWLGADVTMVLLEKIVHKRLGL